MPGNITRIGFGRNSRITWICPGDVCVRSMTPGVVVWKVSHMSRAGWCGGMLSILEVGQIILDLAGPVDLETHVGEDAVDLPHDLGGDVQVGRAGPAGRAKSHRADSR